ncbi:MAG: DUF1489 domain-containing protein [Pseudomonadota bacterium]|jgi:hypothetical protein|nr:DUF1489 domain-containing protein [Pseudomonadota bacterium]MEC9103429.1 DUF1489 domain-containing protein [Pseudomonadota bacterium]
MAKHVNLIKLSVGTESVADLAAWQKTRQALAADGNPRHVTRMFPKRVDEVLDGGSIYWVIKGIIQCRQRILSLDEVDRGDGIRRCAIVLDPELHHTAASPRRPFQGWRYLKPEDTPPDLSAKRANDDALPADLSQALADIGVL